MPIERILETELMDSPAEALAYDSMDHRAVNERFVEDLLAAIASFRFQVSGFTPESSPDGEADSRLLDVLDLGTGTAQIPILLCQRFARCRVMACDAAASMLDQAQYNLAIEDCSHRIELRHVDAKKLPFHETRFDVVMSNSIIHHIPEPLVVLREAVRVVQPGGLLFFRDLLRPESQEELDHLVATYAADCDDHQRQMFADSLHAALSLDEIRALVESLGFAAVSVQPTSDRHWTWVGYVGT
jgi:ubiquinone/menaquinone biosynthesis C-methylase UbiE